MIHFQEFLCNSNKMNWFRQNENIQEIRRRIQRKIKIHNWRNMESLNLHIKSGVAEKMSTVDFQNVVKQFITKLTNLKKLQINSPFAHNIEDQGLETLCREIRTNLIQLESLEFNFAECQNLSNKSLVILGKELSFTYKKLKEFSLDLSECFQFSDEYYHQFAKLFFKHQNQLEKLKFRFIACKKFQDEGLIGLIQGIEKSSNTLKDFSLRFSLCYKMTEKATKVLLTTISKSFPKLEKLHLNLNGEKTSITDHALSGLVESNIKIRPNLTEIRFGLSSLFLSNQGIEYFCEYLSTAINLKILTLDLSYLVSPSKNDTRLITVAKIIKSLSHT